jgi:hypothetical protein
MNAKNTSSHCRLLMLCILLLHTTEQSTTGRLIFFFNFHIPSQNFPQNKQSQIFHYRNETPPKSFAKCTENKKRNCGRERVDKIKHQH